jgi:hypothetical protein
MVHYPNQERKFMYEKIFKTFYINRTPIQRKNERVTVDSFWTEMEAIAYMEYYAGKDKTAKYWVSTRPCKKWEK